MVLRPYVVITFSTTWAYSADFFFLHKSGYLYLVGTELWFLNQYFVITFINTGAYLADGKVNDVFPKNQGSIVYAKQRF